MDQPQLSYQVQKQLSKQPISSESNNHQTINSQEPTFDKHDSSNREQQQSQTQAIKPQKIKRDHSSSANDDRANEKEGKKKKRRSRKSKEQKSSESNAEAAKLVKRQETAGQNGEEKAKKKRRKRKKRDTTQSEQSKQKDTVKQQSEKERNSKQEANSNSQITPKRKPGRPKVDKPLPVVSKKITKRNPKKELKTQVNPSENQIKRKRGRPKKVEPRYKVVKYDGQGEHLFDQQTGQKQFVFEVNSDGFKKQEEEYVHAHKHVPNSNEIYEEEESKESIQNYYARILHSKKDELSEISLNQSISSQQGYGNLSQMVGLELEPSNKEIDELVNELSQQFNEQTLSKLIIQLYTSLILKEPNGKDRKQGIQPTKLQGSKMRPQFAESFANYEDNMQILVESKPSNAKKLYMRDTNAPKFSSKYQEQRWREKFIVATSFVTRGYGLTQLAKYIAENGCDLYIQRNRYKTLSVGVVVDAYRKLEQFLISECKKKIRPLNKDEVRRIVTVLQNCRRHFELQQYTTFLKFLRIVYGISSVTVKQQEAIRLYIVIQKTLRAILSELCLDRQFDTVRCNKQFKTSRSFQKERFLLHRIWSDQLQLELLQKYQRNQTWIKIRDYFKQTYPQHQHYFTVQSLRSRLMKVLRVAVRKTRCFCDKFGKERMPNLIKLSDHSSKQLARSPEALYARLLLIQIYMNDECDLKRLYQTVSAINEFAIMKDHEKSNQMIEAQPMLNSSTEKVLHNMNISRSRMNETTADSKREELIYKGQQQDLEHIVHKEKGGKLHYYRKPQFGTMSAVSNMSFNQSISQSKGGLIDERPFNRTLKNFKAEAAINSKTLQPPSFLQQSHLRDDNDQFLLESMIQDQLRRYEFTRSEKKQ